MHDIFLVRVYDMVESQNGVFDEVQPMLTSLLDGYVSNYKDKIWPFSYLISPFGIYIVMLV